MIFFLKNIMKQGEMSNEGLVHIKKYMYIHTYKSEEFIILLPKIRSGIIIMISR